MTKSSRKRILTGVAVLLLSTVLAGAGTLPVSVEASDDLNKTSKEQALTVTPVTGEISLATDENIYNNLVGVQAGDLITFGRYEQDGNIDNGPEEIKWRVLAVEDGKVLVISEYILDVTYYYYNWSGNAIWRGSHLRSWLNFRFYNIAFSEEEQGMIALTHTVNEDNPDFNTEGGTDTVDKVFQLSIAEAEDYFKDDVDRQVYATQYAINNGAYVWKDTGMSRWWLRSPGKSDKYAAYVSSDGSVDISGVSIGSKKSVGVRPTMWINMESKKTNKHKIGENNPVTEVAVGDLVEIGRYEQDGDESNGAEAIEWCVLAVEDGRALIVSEYALDTKPYNQEKDNNTWEECTLRSWLNDDFYQNAFSEEEKDLIALTQVVNEGNPDFNIEGGNETEDKVFLLSIEEANELLRAEVGNDYFLEESRSRKCLPTQYAKDNGASIVDHEKGTIGWWLRSPGNDSDRTACVDYRGDVKVYGYPVNSTNYCVRPAMYINLDF